MKENIKKPHDKIQSKIRNNFVQISKFCLIKKFF